MATAPQILALRKGEIDFALVQTPVYAPELECEMVNEERLTLALAKTHPLAALRIGKLGRLLDETVFLPTEDESGIREAILSCFARAGGVPLHIQEVERAQTAICLSAAGLGVGVVPESSQTMLMEGVAFRPLPKPFVFIHTYAMWRKKDTFPLLGALRASL